MTRSKKQEAGNKLAPTVFALSVLALSAMATPAKAQQFTAAVRPVSVTRTTPTVDQARRMVETGHWKEAREAFTAIAADCHVRGDYAKDALLELAQLKYMMDDVRGAAMAYEELGGEADIYGDPVTEIDARFKAALLYQESHDKRAVSLQVARVRQLMKSPAIDDETKSNIERRIRNY